MNQLQHTIRTSLCLSTLALAALTGCGAAPDSETGSEPTGEVGEALRDKCGPSVDASIAVPPGNKLAFAYDAVGKQIYECRATATGYAWAFVAPDAVLLGKNGQQVGTHYAGPTWEHQDGSTVVGARVAGFSADPTSVPWLLLSAKSHAGDGRMTDVTYIQRLDTAGGIAPADGCDASHLGTVARQDYVATYYFYGASDAADSCP